MREKEFYRSCATLGVTKEHVILISDPYVKAIKLVTNLNPNHSKLVDNPDAQWDVRDIEKHLLQMVGNHNIETVSATTGGSYALVCFPCF